MPTSRSRPGRILALAQLVGSGIVAAELWRFLPVTIPPVSPLSASGVVAGAAATAAYLLSRPGGQTDEDLACHTHLCGMTGSGKTTLALGQIRRYQARGHGGVWLSAKGGGAVLTRVRPEASVRMLLLDPLSRKPWGINLFRLYSGRSEERERIAGHVVTLFRRLYPQLSEGMGELLRMGTQALLTYSHTTGALVALPHLYALFYFEPFRREVLATVRNPVLHHAFHEDQAEPRTMAAVLRQLRRTVSSEALLITLGQTEGVDLQGLMESDSWLVTDFAEGALGTEVADYLSGVVLSGIEVLTASRGSRRLWHVVADECERYATGSVARAVEISRETRVAWTLVNQAGGQLSDQMELAASMCGNAYWFQTTVKDCRLAQQETGEAEIDFTQLPAHTYLARLRVQGRQCHIRARTRPVPASEEVGEEIRRLNAQGPTRQQILEPLYEVLRGNLLPAAVRPREVVRLWA